MNPGASPWPTTPRSRSDSPHVWHFATFPQGPPSLVLLSSPPPVRVGVPGPPGAVGLCGAVGGRVRAWVGRVRGGFGAVWRCSCSAFSSLTSHGAHGTGEAGRPSVDGPKAHTQGQREADRSDGEARTTEGSPERRPQSAHRRTGTGPGRGPGRGHLEAGQGPEAQARKGPKAHVPARPGAQHASCRAPARLASAGRGQRSRTATTTPGTHRKREGGAEGRGEEWPWGKGESAVRGWSCQNMAVGSAGWSWRQGQVGRWKSGYEGVGGQVAEVGRPARKFTCAALVQPSSLALWAAEFLFGDGPGISEGSQLADLVRCA